MTPRITSFSAPEPRDVGKFTILAHANVQFGEMEVCGVALVWSPTIGLSALPPITPQYGTPRIVNWKAGSKLGIDLAKRMADLYQHLGHTLPKGQKEDEASGLYRVLGEPT
ncbi:hypothetical protein LA66_14030 [Aureimonas altamirensis]|uniref:Uncharacterized protein n=1 Tax=Aureimonas altamirensis TaxID=370622 RepID=A0A0B1Q2F2_9HYPH|nr:hypothetical protein [Aureimonas altamirensis]KHJ54544.1 hypothetical protein LA66_14030 [Aureimonas altamirensis]